MIQLGLGILFANSVEVFVNTSLTLLYLYNMFELVAVDYFIRIE